MSARSVEKRKAMESTCRCHTQRIEYCIPRLRANDMHGAEPCANRPSFEEEFKSDASTFGCECTLSNQNHPENQTSNSYQGSGCRAMCKHRKRKMTVDSRASHVERINALLPPLGARVGRGTSTGSASLQLLSALHSLQATT
jgi:hypothetical protein